MKSRKGAGLIFAIIISIIAIASIVGWGLNIYKFCKCDFKAPYKSEVIYGIGIIAGYGAITGYIDIEDGEKMAEGKND